MRKLAVLLLLVSLMISGCTKATTPQNQKNNDKVESEAPIKAGGTLNIALLKPDTLNPLLTQFSSNREMLSLIYDSLIVNSSSFEAVGGLANSWIVSDNGTKLTLNLRQNVKWQDNSDFSSQDVDFTIGTIQNKDNGSIYAQKLNDVSGTRIINNNTYEITLSHSNAGFIHLLDFPIIKKGSGGKENFTPIGTGKYKYDSYTLLKEIVLIKSELYWGEKPNIEKIRGIMMPDKETGYDSFMINMVDVASCDKQDMGRYTINDKVKSTPKVTNKYSYLGVNYKNSTLADVAVRAILSDAMDKETMVRNLMGDFAITTKVPINPKASFASVEVKSDTTDIKQRLEQLGYDKIDGNSIRYKIVDGKRQLLEFVLLVNTDNSFKKAIGEYIENALSGYGIKIILQDDTWESYNQKLQSGSYDLFLGEVELSADYDLSFLIGTGGPLNFGGFTSPAIDDLLYKINSSDDVAKRNEYFNALQTQFLSELPHIPLYFQMQKIVYDSSSIQNVAVDNIGGDYGSIQKWSIIQTKGIK